MNTPLPLSLAALLLCALPTPAAWPAKNHADSAAEHSTSTLILAGGALPICSDLAPRACREAPPNIAISRTPPRYRTTAEGLEILRFSGLQPPPRQQLAADLREVLGSAAQPPKNTSIELAEIEERLFTHCTSDASPRACASGERSAWQQLTDAERTQVLSALEVAQVDAHGNRAQEVAHPTLSREPHGADVLKAVVDAAAARSSGGSPRVLIVTASALDPMEAVDFYRSAFTALGAQAEWLPLDAALARAIEADDCALVARRAEVLGLHAREQVYPDLHALQQQTCEQPETLEARIASAQAVFFAGGDQWRLRQAFFAPNGDALPWLQTLRQAHARGDLVVGGTSAGAAVQSGAAMLTNGSPASALRAPARNAAPPEPGCARAGLCSAQDEDRLSYWAEGGLGLAADAIVDTHFSERAREPRLLRLLAQTGARLGYGADEASALRVDTHGDIRTITALGREGGWVFLRDAATASDALTAQVFHLGPGARLRIDAQRSALDEASSLSCLDSDASDQLGADAAERALRPGQPTAQADRHRSAGAGGALEPGATRAAARRLAQCGLDAIELPAERGRLIIERSPETRVVLASTGLGIGPLRLRWTQD
jgi:cyanophycinase